MNPETTMFATLVFNIVLQFCITSDVILYIVSYLTDVLKNGRWVSWVSGRRRDSATVVLAVTQVTDETQQTQLVSSTEQPILVESNVVHSADENTESSDGSTDRTISLDGDSSASCSEEGGAITSSVDERKGLESMAETEPLKSEP